FNLSVSFTETVFVQEFTSPEKPGGSNSTNLATNNYKSGLCNLMFAILFSSNLIYNAIEIF
ncbi:1247_t:CDS:1, partial [Funneliformis caledonium]